MPHTYVTPIKPWIVDILEHREANINTSITKSPYVVMTSPAYVVKATASIDLNERAETFKKIISRQTIPKIYYEGCVITNQHKTEDLYSLNETRLGYTINGKPIVVENESGRVVSTPIIESLEIDTDGANNTLKNARVSVKCFTLKQLEMFEVFFLRPGLSLLIEFGDNSLLNKDSLPNKLLNGMNIRGRPIMPFEKPENALLINNSNYGEFVNTFASYSAADRTTISNYNTKIQQSLGSYDFVAGKLTDFSYSIDESGIYNVNLTISQGNQFTLSVPHAPASSTSNTNSPAKNNQNKNEFEENKKIIAADLNMTIGEFQNVLNSKSNGSISNDYWKKEFFNWNVQNTKQEDKAVSNKRYVSLRFVLKVLMNLRTYWTDGFDYTIPKYLVNGKEEEYIPMISHEYLISSSEHILFPNTQLVQFDLDKTDSSTVKVVANGTKKCEINGYSINEANTSLKFLSTDSNQNDFNLILDKNKITSKYKIGNALNIFIAYDQIMYIKKRSYTRLDFLEQICKLVNSNGYGLFDLRPSAINDGGVLQMLDYKLKIVEIEDNVKIYRFKPGTVKSIVRNFSFEMKLSDLVAGKSIFNLQSVISKAIAEKEQNNKSQNNKSSAPALTTQQILDKEIVKAVDMSQYTTSDGYYSIDKVYWNTMEKNKGKIIERINEKIDSTTENEEPKDITKPPDKKTQYITSKIKNFKNPNGKDPMPLIFADEAVIRGNIGNATEKTVRRTLTAIEIKLTIDGLSGFRCGEYFRTDGVPETYNRDGVFEITNVKHLVTPDGWLTELYARYAPRTQSK
jgi:hypothetical protein